MRTATLEFRGVELVCSYEYEPGEKRTWDYPGSPEDARLVEAKVGDVDIVDLLSQAAIDGIEEAILEGLQEWAEA